MSALRIKNTSDRDLRSCEVTAVTNKAQKKLVLVCKNQQNTNTVYLDSDLFRPYLLNSVS